MTTAAPIRPRLRAPLRPAARKTSVLPLVTGDHLTTSEFLRRWEAMPDQKRAELIDGTVFMPSPVSATSHAEPDTLLQFWLNFYLIGHESLRAYSNATLILDTDNTCQPDVVLCSAPKKGGRVWLNEQDYLCGAPELVCEVSASSSSLDMHGKLHAYRRRGVHEYLVWLTQENRIVWHQLVEGEYKPIKERAGKLESLVFPGLVLDVKAALKLDRRKVAAALRAG